MEMQIFNATPKEINDNKHPMFIGISVGVKPMSKQIALSYINWANQHAAGLIPILIADKIAKYNYLAFSHYSERGSLSRAVRDGDKYEEFFINVLKDLPKSKRERFKIIRWQHI